MYLCLSFSFSFSASGIEVIVNARLEIDQLSVGQLRRVFSMKQTLWPNGEEVIVYVLPKNNPLHKKFTTEVIHLFPYQLERTWNKLVYSGMGKPPILVGSEAEMLEKVSLTEGAIGYIESIKTTASIRKVEIVKQ